MFGVGSATDYSSWQEVYPSAQEIEPAVQGAQIMKCLFDEGDDTIEELAKKLPSIQSQKPNAKQFIENSRSDDGSFLIACADGDVAKVGQYLAKDSVTSSRDTRGKTGLHIAAMGNQGAVIQTLLNAGFDPNITEGDYKGSMCRTPLHDAVLAGSFAAAKALLQSGKCQVDTKDGTGFTALHYAAKLGHVEFIKLLLSYKASPFKGNQIKTSALLGVNAFLVAVQFSHIPAMHAILSATEERAGLYQKPLVALLFDVACRQEIQDCFTSDVPVTVEMICTQEGFIREEYQPLVRSLAIFRQLLKLLLKEEHVEGVEGLFSQAICGENSFGLEMLYWLKQRGIISQVDGETMSLHEAAKRGDCSAIRVLLRNGQNPNAVNEDGHRPLYLAAKKGHKRAVGLLAGVTDLAAAGDNLETAFFVAARKVHHELLPCLYVDGGVDTQNEDCDTPLTSALSMLYLEDEDEALQRIEHTVEFLLTKQASVLLEGAQEKTAVGLVEDTLDDESRIYQLVMDAKKAEEERMVALMMSQITLGETVQENPLDGSRVEQGIVAPMSALSIQEHPLVESMSKKGEGDEKSIDYLALYVERLKAKESLDDFENIFEELSRDGCNVLHLIAKQPDFSQYRPVLEKHSSHPHFGKLIAQETKARALTPLHEVCLYQNEQMLSFLAEVSTPKFRDYLILAGGGRCKFIGGNVLHYLAISCKRKGHVNQDSTKLTLCNMFDVLLKLFGKQQTMKLICEKAMPSDDAPVNEEFHLRKEALANRNVFVLANNTFLITKLLDFIPKVWDEQAFLPYVGTEALDSVRE